jgi:hypothetical protein
VCDPVCDVVESSPSGTSVSPSAESRGCGCDPRSRARRVKKPTGASATKTDDRGRKNGLASGGRQGPMTHGDPGDPVSPDGASPERRSYSSPILSLLAKGVEAMSESGASALHQYPLRYHYQRLVNRAKDASDLFFPPPPNQLTLLRPNSPLLARLTTGGSSWTSWRSALPRHQSPVAKAA